MIALVVSLAGPAHSALAVDYPTWDELQQAKSNTAAAAAKVAEIKTLIGGLQDQVAATEAEAEAKGVALQDAQFAFDAATRRAADLAAQAKESAKTADAATRQAGQLASQLYRTGGTDLSVNLLLQGSGNGAGAEQLLSKLGSMSKLVERSTEIYEDAQTAENTARSLGDQAEAAKKVREQRRVEAQKAMAEAQAAADAAAAALAESQAKSVELKQQLAFLQDTEAKTATAYKEGVAERARIAAAKEAARRAAEEAAREAAAEAAAESGSSGAGLGGGYVGDEGWAVPANGRITDGYGPRAVICGNDGCSKGYHSGTDLGAGCGANIYAAHSGTVDYAGRMGTYGNFILLDNGGGVSTGYAHIVDGGIHVDYGEHVEAGEVIASVGETGAADGCHLHFEVRINGSTIDAEPFMADRGAPLG
ncbi:M23 family metallopeptidase [Cryobacterium tepidiphilum]|uniref:M23 family metallopeptidase n=1 Tax=Cryobacterium tepidiphilum TaxID=2486026 RepID=UPI001F222786|nr:M23 family metallopeptidase [Cryobacterium tepidiphilum]